MRAELHTGHGQKGNCEIHAVFEDYIPERDDTGCGCKSYKKCNDAERDQAQSPIDKKGQDD
jgi:hypothetical protein